jgi:hypothetical protein
MISSVESRGAAHVADLDNAVPDVSKTGGALGWVQHPTRSGLVMRVDPPQALNRPVGLTAKVIAKLRGLFER